MMMFLKSRNIIFFCAVVLFPSALKAQIKTYKFEEIDSLYLTQKKPLVIFLYTEWCNICLAMENTTFQDEEIAELLNSEFYFVRLNAEEKKTIDFRDQSFNFNPNGTNIGIHELAYQLGNFNGEMIFPTITVLNTDNEIVLHENSFIKSSHLHQLLLRLIF